MSKFSAFISKSWKKISELSNFLGQWSRGVFWDVAMLIRTPWFFKGIANFDNESLNVHLKSLDRLHYCLTGKEPPSEMYLHIIDKLNKMVNADELSSDLNDEISLLYFYYSVRYELVNDRIANSYLPPGIQLSDFNNIVVAQQLDLNQYDYDELLPRIAFVVSSSEINKQQANYHHPAEFQLKLLERLGRDNTGSNQASLKQVANVGSELTPLTNKSQIIHNALLANESETGVLSGLNAYLAVRLTKLSFLSHLCDRERGEKRAKCYQSLFQSDAYTLSQRLLFLYAMFVSKDGQSLQSVMAGKLGFDSVISCRKAIVDLMSQQRELMTFEIQPFLTSFLSAVNNGQNYDSEKVQNALAMLPVDSEQIRPL